MKEYVYQYLNQPLQTDSVYCLSFYASRADRFPFSIKQLGAYFSNTLPTTPSGYINSTPQVVNQNVFLTDTIGWMEIQGCFTALGGEQYITIGNFNSNANTDTLRIQSTNPLTGTGTDVAYYYIDSVSLWQNNFPTGLNEITKGNSFSVYPNPNNGSMVLSYNLGDDKEASMDLYDVTGKLINSYELQNTIGQLEINQNQLQNGIYFYRILVKGKIINTNKIVIIK